MHHDNHTDGDRPRGLRVTERIIITPSRRQDPRPAPLIIRFSPSVGEAGDDVTTREEQGRW